MLKEELFIITALRYLNAMKRNNKFYILFIMFILLSNIQYTYTNAAVITNGRPYHIKTKRYERSPDNRTVRIEFAKIEGLNKRSEENINYMIEKEAFRLASDFIDPDLLEKEATIFNAMDKLKKQDIYVGYDILYQNQNILSIECRGESSHYSKRGNTIQYVKDGKYLVFDINTGKKLVLSDYITIDRRIINYKAADYQAPDYDSDVFQTFYSFKDAFQVYESKKHGDYNIMSVKEALKRLKNGNIEWGIKDGKKLYLCTSYGAESRISIPYSYIKDFAKY